MNLIIDMYTEDPVFILTMGFVLVLGLVFWTVEAFK